MSQVLGIRMTCV